MRILAASQTARARRAIAFAAVTLALACAGAPDEDRDTLVVALVNAPTHLDPRIGSDQSSARVFDVMLNGLVAPGPDGRFVPDLAERWQVLDDGSRYRFHLRPDVVFHDGRPLSADDVVWTFETLLDGTVISPKKGAFVQLERVEAVDPRTVDFHLSEPYGAFLANLTSYLGIVPNGMTPDDFNRGPVGTGPFRLVEQRPGRLVFEAFDGYREEHRGVRTLVLREIPDATVRALELRKGSVHLVVNDLPPDVVSSFRDDPGFQVIDTPGANYAYLGLNLEDPVLSDPVVRRAIALAIDRPQLVETLWRGLGVVTETLVRPGHWAHHDGLEPIVPDPTAARRLLDEAGHPDPDGDGPQPRFSLTYKTSTDETNRLQAQIIQSMLAEVGIAIEIRSFEFATFYNDVKQGNFQMFSLVWTGTVDPDIYSLILHSERIPPAGANRGRYRNPEFDAAVEAGARLAEPAERRPHYLRAQEILARDLPYISLFIKNNVAVLPVELEGYRNYPNGEFYSLRDVRWADL